MSETYLAAMRLREADQGTPPLGTASLPGGGTLTVHSVELRNADGSACKPVTKKLDIQDPTFKLEGCFGFSFDKAPKDSAGVRQVPTRTAEERARAARQVQALWPSPKYEVDYTNFVGQTVLHTAAIKGLLDAGLYAMACGVDPTAACNRGSTALFYCEKFVEQDASGDHAKVGEAWGREGGELHAAIAAYAEQWVAEGADVARAGAAARWNDSAVGRVAPLVAAADGSWQLAAAATGETDTARMTTRPAVALEVGPAIEATGTAGFGELKAAKAGGSKEAVKPAAEPTDVVIVVRCVPNEGLTSSAFSRASACERAHRSFQPNLSARGAIHARLLSQAPADESTRSPSTRGAARTSSSAAHAETPSRGTSKRCAFARGGAATPACGQSEALRSVLTRDPYTALLRTRRARMPR